MTDELEGISVGINADIGQLTNQLRAAEQQLTSTARKLRKESQISMRVTVPRDGEPGSGSYVLQQFRNTFDTIKSQVLQGEPIPIPIKAEVTQAAIDDFSSSIGEQLKKLSFTIPVKGKWVGWETPPPDEIIIPVRGSGGGGGGTTGGRRGGGGTSGGGASGAELPDRLQRDGPTGREVREATKATRDAAQAAPQSGKPVTESTHARQASESKTVEKAATETARAVKTTRQRTKATSAAAGELEPLVEGGTFVGLPDQEPAPATKPKRSRVKTSTTKAKVEATSTAEAPATEVYLSAAHKRAAEVDRREKERIAKLTAANQAQPSTEELYDAMAEEAEEINLTGEPGEVKASVDKAAKRVSKRVKSSATEPHSERAASPSATLDAPPAAGNAANPSPTAPSELFPPADHDWYENATTTTAGGAVGLRGVHTMRGNRRWMTLVDLERAKDERALKEESDAHERRSMAAKLGWLKRKYPKLSFRLQDGDIQVQNGPPELEEAARTFFRGEDTAINAGGFRPGKRGQTRQRATAGFRLMGGTGVSPEQTEMNRQASVANMERPELERIGEFILPGGKIDEVAFNRAMSQNKASPGAKAALERVAMGVDALQRRKVRNLGGTQATKVLDALKTANPLLPSAVVTHYAAMVAREGGEASERLQAPNPANPEETLTGAQGIARAYRDEFSRVLERTYPRTSKSLRRKGGTGFSRTTNVPAAMLLSSVNSATGGIGMVRRVAEQEATTEGAKEQAKETRESGGRPEPIVLRTSMVGDPDYGNTALTQGRLEARERITQREIAAMPRAVGKAARVPLGEKGERAVAGRNRYRTLAAQVEAGEQLTPGLQRELEHWADVFDLPIPTAVVGDEGPFIPHFAAGGVPPQVFEDAARAKTLQAKEDARLAHLRRIAPLGGRARQAKRRAGLAAAAPDVVTSATAFEGEPSEPSGLTTTFNKKGEVAGFSSGTLRVFVVNWPSGIAAGNRAGESLFGLRPGEQERALRGRGGQITAEEMAAALEEEGKGKPEKPELLGAATRRARLNAAIKRGTLSVETAKELINQRNVPNEDLLGPDQRPLSQAIQDVRDQLAQARQGLPIRSFPVSVAQLVAGPARGKATARFQQAGELLTEAERLEKVNAGVTLEIQDMQAEEDHLNALKKTGIQLTKEQAAREAELPTIIKEKKTLLQDNNKLQEKNVVEAAKLAQLTGGEKLANLSKSLVSSIGGTLAYTTALAAAGVGIAYVSQRVLKLTNALTNFGDEGATVSKQLGAATQALHGLAAPTVAGTFVSSGLKGPVAEALRPTLESQAQISAGLSAFDLQSQLIKAGFSFSQTPNPGVASSVGGGLFGIGAEKGAFERIRDELENLIPVNSPLQRFGVSEDVRNAEIEANRVKIEGTLNKELQTLGIRIKTGTDAQIATQHDLIAKVPSSRDFLANQTQAQILADKLSDVGQVLVDAQGNVLSGEQLTTALTEGLKNVAKPTAQELVNQATPSILAARELMIREADFRRTSEIPAQFGISAIAAPPLPVGSTINPALVQAAGGPFAPANLFSTGRNAQARALFEARRQQGIDALLSNVGQFAPNQLGATKDLLSEIDGLTTRINNRKLEVISAQQVAQAKEIQNSLIVANRQVRDMALLSGAAIGGPNELGTLQRQQLLGNRQVQQLQVQSQGLGFLEQQRQVNFAVASAGFTAGGVTAEEIAARQAEAERRARVQQQQLTLAEQVFAIQSGLSPEQAASGAAVGGLIKVGFQIEDITLDRGYQDALRARATLGANIALQLTTQQAQAEIDDLSAVVQEDVAQIQANWQQATGVFQQGLQFAAQASANLADNAAAADQSFTHMAEIWANLFGVSGSASTSGGTSVTGGFGPTADGGRHAAGGMYNISGATNMVVGEAGTETVAILRNPRRLGSTPGGGMSLTINVQNPIVRNDGDINAIVQRTVEAINRRVSLLGYRNPL
jgi:hypothetical protein